jgi:cysteine-S-conjugate beta-lyase
MKTETLVTKLGRNPQENYGVVNPPVYHASTILFATLKEFEDSEKSDGVNPLVYGRSGTPATRSLEEAIAVLDNADHAIVTSSGQSAILVALLSVLSAGDHLLLPDNVYGSMRKMCKQEILRFGIEISYYDAMTDDITAYFKPNTKVVYCEAPGSLTFEVQDIAKIAQAAHKINAVVMADSTWATPIYSNAFAQGVDINIHSATKYISGHSDLVMGIITCGKKHYAALRQTFRNFGACAGADELYLASRGLRTLSTRLSQHQTTALQLANWLKTRKEVVKILHPAFAECSGHENWKRNFTGSSGLFSILLKNYDKEKFAQMIDNMELFGMGFSWGGYESLIMPFTPYRTISKWTHNGLCLRIHAGLEHIDDLINDLAAGLDRLSAD